MIIMATGVIAGAKLHIRVAWALFGYVFVAVETKIFWESCAHFASDFLTVFPVTTDTEAGVHMGQKLRVTGIGKLAPWMGVIHGFKCRAMTFHAGFLHVPGTRKGTEVAGGAGQLDLVVSIRGFTNKKKSFVSNREFISEKCAYQKGKQAPPKPAFLF